MRNLLNTVICILLTSPLAAFDISLEGVEFGTIEIENINLPADQNAISMVSSARLVLNEGDVVQILDVGSNEVIVGNTYNSDTTSCMAIFTDINEPDKAVLGQEGAIFVGPGKLRIRIFSDGWQALTNGYAKVSYAVLRAGASTQSSYVTIPANPSGNFEVKLQTSSDLQTWSPTTPGIFPYGDNAKFFRLVVE